MRRRERSNGSSWQIRSWMHAATYIGTANVLRCCRMVTPKGRVLAACSSAEYGDVKREE